LFVIRSPEVGKKVSLLPEGKKDVALDQFSCPSLQRNSYPIPCIRVVLWFFGFIVLSLIWFMTRRKGRTCPHCGEDVKKGRTTCKNCGYDFTIGGKPPAEAGATT